MKINPDALTALVKKIAAETFNEMLRSSATQKYVEENLMQAPKAPQDDMTYNPWLDCEQMMLRRAFYKFCETMADIHCRSIGAISSRIRHILN